MDAIFWAMLLVSLGVVLIVAEVFLPSHGLLSVLATSAIVASIIVAFTGGIRSGVIVLLVNTLVIPAVLVAAVKWWPHTPIGRLILIPRPEHPDDVLPDTDSYRVLRSLIGHRGRAISKMLPSGAVKIDGRTYDAVSDGIAIEMGQPVEVSDVRNNRLVVRPFTGVMGDVSEGVSPGEGEPDDVLARPAESLGIEGFEEPLA